MSNNSIQLYIDNLEQVRQRNKERRKPFKNILDKINNPYYCSNVINGIPCYKCRKEVFNWTKKIIICEENIIELENHSINIGIPIPTILTFVLNQLIIASERCITSTYENIKEARIKFKVAYDEYMDQENIYREYLVIRPNTFKKLIQESFQKEMKNLMKQASAAAA